MNVRNRKITLFLARRRASAPPPGGSDAPIENSLDCLRIAVGFDDRDPTYRRTGCGGCFHPRHEQEMPLIQLIISIIYSIVEKRRMHDEARKAFELIEDFPDRPVELVIREEDLRSSPRHLLLSVALLLTGLRQDPSWIQQHTDAATGIAAEVLDNPEFRLPSLETLVAGIQDLFDGTLSVTDLAADLKAWFEGWLTTPRELPVPVSS